MSALNYYKFDSNHVLQVNITEVTDLTKITKVTKNEFQKTKESYWSATKMDLFSTLSDTIGLLMAL